MTMQPPRRVKLLCSAGGRILPRPSDGALRYVGGHTRIVSVPVDIPFADLAAKMSEVASGAPVTFKYQLPNEDLDALISVSCAEDLENMMDEYEKIAASSPDGSAKIRVFLFSPTESSELDVGDAGQRYFDAVNGIGNSNENGGSSVGSLKRKDSGLSAGSSNSGIEAVDGVVEGNAFSPQTLNSRPEVNFGGQGYQVPPHLNTHPVNFVEPQNLNSNNAMNLGNLAESQYSTSNSPINFGNLGALHLNANAMPMSASAVQASNRTAQPLSQFPPLPPMYQQAQYVGAYGLDVSPEAGGSEGQTARLDDCNMCHKVLPHAHSDAVVPVNVGSGSPVSAKEPVFYSQQPEDGLRSRVPPPNLVDNVVEPRVDPHSGAYRSPQAAEAQYGGERPFVGNIDNVDRSMGFASPASTAFSPDSQAPYGLFLGNSPHSQLEEPQMQQQQRQQQQQLWQQSAGSPPYPLGPETIIKPIGNDTKAVGADVRLVRNTGGSPEFANEYVRPVNGMMEGLHLSPTTPPGFSGQGNAGMPDGSNFIIDPATTSGFSRQGNQVMRDGSTLMMNSPYGYLPQVGEVMLPGRPFPNAVVFQERNHSRLNDQVQLSSPDLSHMNHFAAADPSQVVTMSGNQSPFPYHLGRVEPPIPSEGLLATSAYTYAVDPAHSERQLKKVPIGRLKVDSSNMQSRGLFDYLAEPQSGNIPSAAVNATDKTTELQPKDMFDHSTAPRSNNLPPGLSHVTGPPGILDAFQEPSPTDSLFCNQDPRKILGGAHPLPPRPKRVASRELIAPKDTGVQVHLGNSTESDIIALLEEGGLRPSLDSPKKDLHPDHTQPVKDTKGSGDEQIKQDLQAVAEGVASSVLNSSLTADSVQKTVVEGNGEMQWLLVSPDKKIEDNKPKAGLHITDDIGRLQIIKNSDLEELRELGSGTFGTVYHGKWRGTDVAIKRINDRCFAGKPSEQERMRADFWNEACKLADLHHPNVVAFYGVVLDGPGGSVATVTEYMVNGSLRNALQGNDQTRDPRKRLLIAMDVAFGMEYLHGKNIVHFDLKSDNLLVNLRDPQRPICKVGDLGLSKVKCQTLISGGVRGTLPWMAPELLNGSSSLVSEKVDVFSYGIVMWELLTGEEPYADLHYGAIIGGIVSNTLRPPVPETCDPEWRTLMERCWSAEPSERPSFTEIAERLRSIAASLAQKGHAQIQK